MENFEAGVHAGQCSKLTVHSAPGAHISAAGRTFIHPIIIAIYQRSAQKNSWAHSKKMYAPYGRRK